MRRSNVGKNAVDLRSDHLGRAPPVIFYLHGWDDRCARTKGLTTPHSFAAFTRMMAAHSSLHVGSVFWTLQTYAILRDRGLSVVFDGGRRIPRHGVVIGHNHALLPGWRTPHPIRRLADRTRNARSASRGNLLVALRADRMLPSPIADLHVVQNPNDPLIERGAAHHIPHWPQFDLLPRVASRADRFESLGYFGRRRHLALGLRLPSFGRDLRALGVDLCLVDQRSPQRWSDYRGIDAVLAVRRFTKNTSGVLKPASKLVNAWLAGVPAIVGAESAYRSVGSHGIDFLEATSVQEVLDAVARLRDDGNLRATLVANGLHRARDYSRASVADRWDEFIREVAIPRFIAKRRHAG